MNALGTLGKIAEKPSDKKIRLTRAIFALLLLAVIVFGWNTLDAYVSFFDIRIVDIPFDEYILPILFIFPVVGLIRAIFDPGIFKKSIWKKIIISFATFLLIASIFFIRDREIIPPVITENTSTDINSLSAETETDYFSIIPADILLGFFGFVLLLAGVFNNRNITTKNEKFGETIKKIRV